MTAERLTKLAAKTNNFGGGGPNGFNGVTQADIAYAMAGTSGPIYELLMIKYVYPNCERTIKLRRSVENSILEIVDDPAAVEKAIAAFLSNNICPKCNGEGSYRRENRHISACRRCDGFGVIEFKITGESEAIHRQLLDAENIALERMARRLH